MFLRHRGSQQPLTLYAACTIGITAAVAAAAATTAPGVLGFWRWRRQPGQGWLVRGGWRWPRPAPPVILFHCRLLLDAGTRSTAGQGNAFYCRNARVVQLLTSPRSVLPVSSPNRSLSLAQDLTQTPVCIVSCAAPLPPLWMPGGTNWSSRRRVCSSSAEGVFEGLPLSRGV
ncbi:unnamed protein product [Ectocarpus sp. 12 AP-2014]